MLYIPEFDIIFWKRMVTLKAVATLALKRIKR